jgi:oligoribonuclease
MKDKENLIWIDLEMSGLNVEKNQIIEIATVVTDKELNILANGPVFAIQTDIKHLEAMDDWNQKQHRGSGLYQRVLNSKVSCQQAELMTIAFLKAFIDASTSPMCGNTISMDRQFLNRYMPKLAEFFHYRQIDVSSIKELAKRWYKDLPKFEKTSQHLALNDIYDSIEELKFYRQLLFKDVVHA